MNHLLPYLRRALVGIAVAGALGFGATSAFARPDTASSRPPICMPGTEGCNCLGFDYCVMEGECPCW